MKTIRATIDHWPEIERFVRRARHVYADAGREDLPGLIRSSVAIVGMDNQSGEISGLMVFQHGSRPPTLPAGAPDRILLRYAALASKSSPIVDLAILMDSAWPWLAEDGRRYQLQAYGSQRWLVKPLLASGFEIDERIEFLRLTGLQQRFFSSPERSERAPAADDDLTVRPASPDDLAPLARLDAAAFPPRWHFGEDALLTLLIGGAVRLAFAQERLVGYWAQSHARDLETHLARLAIAPDLQGRGLGRRLLADAIEYAHAEKFESILLNTQTDNRASQALYRSFGFRSTGRIVPILVRVDEPMTSTESARPE